MSDLPTPYELGDLTRLSDGLLPHTYTRIRASGGGFNTEGNQDSVPGPEEPGVPCRYRVEDQVTVTADGVNLVSTPTLRIAHDDVLAPDDTVTSILDSAGTVLLIGPVVVETVLPQAAFGSVMRKRATLRGTVVERSV